jgi:protein phosphatase
MPMQIAIPDKSLVLLIGASGSGKSTFAARHFKPTEVLSSDRFRAMLCDDESAQHVSAHAFELLHQVCDKRLHFERLTVIDATNTRTEARKPFLAMAKHHHYPVVAIVFDLPVNALADNDQARPDRHTGEEVIHRHVDQLRHTLDRLAEEGYHSIHVLKTLAEVNLTKIELQYSSTKQLHRTGPFDLIGDVHGCFEELQELLVQLNYRLDPVFDFDGRPTFDVSHPENRTLVFVGDLVDRGPDTPSVLRLVARAMDQGKAMCVMGNHDFKLLGNLRGNAGKVPGGMQVSLHQINHEPDTFRDFARDFLASLPYHLILDHGKLVVAHAGLRQDYHGQASRAVRDFALYGDTNGQLDDAGVPIRFNWASQYRGTAMVIYGHVPIQQLDWIHHTLCIDTGCVFGGSLTALRYPERETVSVPAKLVYWDSPSTARRSIWELPQRRTAETAR